MKPNPPSNNCDDNSSLEDDEIWDMLSQSPTEKASPMFTQNTVRAARLSQNSTRDSWHKLLRPSLSIGAITAVIVIGAFFLIGENSKVTTPQLVEIQNQTPSETDWLNEALLNSAIEEPELFTDAEIVAMVF